MTNDVKLPSDAPVVYESQDSMRIYRLNRPKALNSLNHEMITSLRTEIKKWRQSDLCRVIVARGDERAFCAGGDVKSLIQDLKKGDAAQNIALPFFKDEFELNWLLARLGKPYVSLMDGIVMGGGCGIALPAPIRIATPRTHFAMPETKIGYAPDVGVNYYLAQLDGNLGAWLAITGHDLYGRAVYELGLATHYVSESALDSIVQEIQQLSNPNLTQVSNIIANHTSPVPPRSAALSSKESRDGHSPIKGEIMAFLDRAFDCETIKEIYEKLDRASNDFELSEEVRAWAREQKTIMDARSPTGMAVALEGYRMAKNAKRLDVTLDNDMSMATAFAGKNRSTNDFVTGVSSLLIEKSRDRPHWQPNDISDPAVSPADIKAKFFDLKGEIKEHRPELDLQPPSVSEKTKGPDSTWGQFGRYGLPSQLEVMAKVEGYAPSAGAFKVTEAELIDRVLDDRGESGGPRETEMQAKVKDLVSRLCEVKEGGYLDWRRS
ncbi:putative 3-hydroxyisobutyryl-CoA hydrolase [Kockovaella imperatae]|uniref:3-hydroxyisobutyryl-CoA hydrolase n=1 Tax=Kockovaella imperatae TaxID=4999 RepID=A0A1Y1UF13_9TREE|nr:putative 3-hydroxyisobutyryl-CoA hydrolase [Kockovaella imperatae]ORX36633.1 putative 3-hydroxyisobutyryl-CoA hydrolase [Kockovaella imperatae]